MTNESGYKRAETNKKDFQKAVLKMQQYNKSTRNILINERLNLYWCLFFKIVNAIHANWLAKHHTPIIKYLMRYEII